MATNTHDPRSPRLQTHARVLVDNADILLTAPDPDGTEAALVPSALAAVKSSRVPQRIRKLVAFHLERLTAPSIAQFLKLIYENIPIRKPSVSVGTLVKMQTVAP